MAEARRACEARAAGGSGGGGMHRLLGPISAIIVTLTLIAAPSVTRAEPVQRLAEIVLKTREARLSGDKAAWLTFARKAVALAPEHQDLLFSLARAEAANGNTDNAFPLLADAVRRGGGFDLAAAQELASLRTDPRFRPIEAQNAINLKPIARAELHVEFNDPTLTPEGITYDHAGKRFFVGSLRGELWQVAADRKPKLFAKPGAALREVFGLKIDPARNVIWAANGVFPDVPPPPKPKPDEGVAAITALSLADASISDWVMLDARPVRHGFNDLAVARNGDVYITDTEAQTIYLLKAGGPNVETFLEANDLTFVNGIVFSADEKTLYVAHVEGISAIDLATRARKRLAIGPDMAVGSIDGLAQKDGDLIGVQNSANLARVIRMRLSPDGASIRQLNVMAARGLLDLGATTGVVVDDAFYVVASAPPGAGSATPPPPNPRILRIPF
jgi:sugar lactone lactonase YvrE